MIGNGAHGYVLLFRHVLSEIKYAIKIINKKSIQEMLEGTDEDFNETELVRYATKKQLKNILPALQV